MEAFAQGRQREITLESFALVARARPDVQCFNEILIQYPKKGERPLGQVVPDNFVVVHPERIVLDGHFSTHVQPVRPLLVIEYVSKHNRRKDYDVNFLRYERQLQAPYYLLFYPDNEDLSLFRLENKRYESVRPNAAGRLDLPEIELEVALHDGWVRYWFRGELLPLPAELADQRDEERAARGEAERERDAASARADTERTARFAAEAEVARLRDEMARLRGAG